MSNWFKKCFPEYCEETEKGVPSKRIYKTESLAENRDASCGEDGIFGRVYTISTDSIKPNRNQPRKNFDNESIEGLADSIRQYGVLHPLTVRRKASHFELVAGERRYRAALMLGLKTVPCIIIQADDERSATLAIIENIQREDLNMFETAEALRSLTERHGLTQEEVGRSLSMSQSCVANKLRLLRFGKYERGLMLEHGLSERHARSLLRISDAEKRKRALVYITEHRLGIKEAEEYVEKLLNKSKAPRKGKRMLVIKDVRIFYNTIGKAVQTLKHSGIDVASEQREDENYTEILLRIPKRNVSRETDTNSDDTCNNTRRDAVPDGENAV